MTAGGSDRWSPAQYDRFRREREEPFDDLLALIDRRPAMRVLDLGCGTGALTSRLATALSASFTRGIDASEAMLAQASSHAREGLVFERGDIGALSAASLAGYDLLFSNAALQWVDDAAAVLARAYLALAPGAQLAVQVPKNQSHPSHAIARALAREAPFAASLEGAEQPGFPTGEACAELLWSLGARAITVREVLYLHELESSAAVVDWTRGTLLNSYLPRLAPPLREQYLETYRARLLDAVGERAPYLYPFRRLLLHVVRHG